MPGQDLETTQRPHCTQYLTTHSQDNTWWWGDYEYTPGWQNTDYLHMLLNLPEKEGGGGLVKKWTEKEVMTWRLIAISV